MLQWVEAIQLSKELVLMVFLPPLLFEGALHFRAAILRPRTWLVLSLSILGPLLTSLIVGAAAHWLLGFDLLSGLLLGAIGLTLIVQLAAVYLPFLQTILKTVPPSLTEWMIVIAASLAPALAIELYKLVRA
jgi:NhaP-type Na+/H+ and K+/H+ antiporter